MIQEPKMSKEIKFVCQNEITTPMGEATGKRVPCGETMIEEVNTDVTVVSDVDSITLFDDGKIDTVYGEQTNEGGHVVRYQCKKCGSLIVDDDSEHAEDGLDEHALVKAIEALNAVKDAKGEVVGCDALLNLISEAHENLDGDELTEVFNNFFPGQKVKYLGNSLFEVTG